MDSLPEFIVVRPRSLKEAIEARGLYPDARFLGGGTDLLVNIRRGIVAPPVLIDINGLGELHEIKADKHELRVGSAVTLTTLASHPGIVQHYPIVAEAAAQIAGPTQRNMGTVGGNLCLDTRCIFYNQSEWWRGAVNHCLKTTGPICHVAPKSRGLCFATFSGDLAPSLLVLDAVIDLEGGPAGRRRIPLADFYIGYARQETSSSETSGDGMHYLSLQPGEIVVEVRITNIPELQSGYDKIRVRRSIEYPIAGVGAAIRRQGDMLSDLRIAITGTNPRPVRLAGTEALCGRRLDHSVFEGIDALVRDQIMSMKTTLTPGHYRRRIASVLAQRLVRRLFER
jgi:4-hydroxybenzoyl-CoA reductase subunit beta